MKSSIVNKSILAVAMLMVACFAGFAVVGEDTDAAETPYTVSIDGTADFGDGLKYTNVGFANNVAVDGNVITGSVTKVTDANKVDASIGFKADADHFLVFSINGIPAGYFVTFEMSDKSIKSAQVKETDQNRLDFLWAINADNMDYTMTYAVTPAAQTSLAGLQTYTVDFNLQMDVKEIQIEYTINGLTIIQRTTTGAAYSLVALDALNQTVPDGKRFVGWSQETSTGINTYPVGTTLIISNEMEGKYKYEAVFEDLPAIVITFIDGTSKVAECNVTEIAAKVPAMEKVGYDFTGWYLNGVIVDPMTYTFSESAVLVAGWEPIKCFVTFTVDGVVYQKQTVEYNDFATQPVAPKGFQGWDFNFATPITGDITVEAIPEPAAEPTGADNPMTLTVYILVAFVIIGLIACLVYLLKEGKLVIGRGSKVVKVEAPAEEEPKQ